jgi:hypothetical protein
MRTYFHYFDWHIRTERCQGIFFIRLFDLFFPLMNSWWTRTSYHFHNPLGSMIYASSSLRLTWSGLFCRIDRSIYIIRVSKSVAKVLKTHLLASTTSFYVTESSTNLLQSRKVSCTYSKGKRALYRRKTIIWMETRKWSKQYS